MWSFSTHWGSLKEFNHYFRFMLNARVLLSPCFSNFLSRTTSVLESLPEATNPGQDAIFGDFVFNSSNSCNYSLIQGGFFNWPPLKISW